MNNTHKFAELDKLAEGLRGRGPEFEADTLKNTPEHKKWKSALNALPKKDQQEYKQQKYEESRKEKALEKSAEIREEELKKLFEKEIRPETQIVYFWLGEGVVKEHKLLKEREAIKGRIISEKELKKEVVQNIEVPEIVDIDYSEIKDLHISKYGGALLPYKDGFLIVRDDNPKGYQNFQISDYVGNPKVGSKMFFHTLLMKDNVHYYLRADDIEKVKDHKDNVNLYFVYKRAYKNKAFKIKLKNNKSFSHILKLFEKDKNLIEKERIVLDVISVLPPRLITNYMESLGVLERYETFKDIEEKGKNSEELRNLGLENLNISKERILKAGYDFSLFSKFIGLVTRLKSVLSDKRNKKFENTILEKFLDVDPNDVKALTTVLLDLIKQCSIKEKEFREVNETYILARRTMQAMGKLDLKDLTQNIFDLIVTYRHTEEGTSLLITGKIDVEKATEIDCFYYWNYINLFNLTNGCLAREDFPLLLDDGKIFNENKFYKHVHEAKMTVGASPFRSPNEQLDINPETKTLISEILTEAMEQTTGLLIPYNACVEIKDDPVFKYIRFIEYEKYIAIFAHDQNDRFISELYVKGEKEFRYWLYNSGQVFDSKVTDSSKHLYLKLACCIRDWKVLIERDSTMKYRGPRVPTGVKSSRPRQIWLPITSYKRSTNQEQKSREKVFFNESRKFSGERRAHRRRLREGTKASKLQKLLAEDANIYVGDGYTFVRRTEWGKIKKSKRELKYRSRSMNTLLFKSDYEVKKAKEIKDLSPAGFEERMEDYVAEDNWKVRSKKNYEDSGSGDGGIDIKAIKEFKDGTIKELIGQCKHPMISKKPIGPGVLRELVGAAADVKSKHEKVLMCMTSTWFTQGAIEYADRHQITLVTGGDLLK